MEDVSGLGDESEGKEHRDRLSELPNSLILVILSLLPIKDVVRTSVLSKLWKDMWTTIPVLDFGYISCSNNCSDVFVNRVLKLWKGNKITKFRFSVYCRSATYIKSGFDVNCRCSATYIKSWLDFAMDHGVEELWASLCSDYGYCVPPRLFSYSTIRKLSLFCCDNLIIENVLWNRLKSLEISVKGLEGHVIDKILSGAPQLEVLDLIATCVDNVNIHSSSLKQLTIDLDGCLEEVPNTTLSRIWAPNLQSLEITGALRHRYLVMNHSSVKDITLNLDCNDSIGEMLSQFFPTILCAEKVTLSGVCMPLYQALGALGRKYLLSLSSHFKFARVRCYSYDDHIYSDMESIVNQHRSSEQQHVKVMRGEDDFYVEIFCSSSDEKLMFLLNEILLEYHGFAEEMVIWANPEGRTSKSF